MNKYRPVVLAGGLAGGVAAFGAFWQVVMAIGFTIRETCGEADLGHDPHPELTMLHLCFAFAGSPVSMIAGVIYGSRLGRRYLR